MLDFYLLVISFVSQKITKVVIFCEDYLAEKMCKYHKLVFSTEFIVLQKSKIQLKTPVVFLSGEPGWC